MKLRSKIAIDQIDYELFTCADHITGYNKHCDMVAGCGDRDLTAAGSNVNRPPPIDGNVNNHVTRRRVAVHSGVRNRHCHNFIFNWFAFKINSLYLQILTFFFRTIILATLHPRNRHQRFLISPLYCLERRASVLKTQPTCDRTQL